MKLEEVKKAYGKLAKNYDLVYGAMFKLVFRIEKYREEAIDWLKLREGDTVLDLGCGTGMNFSFLEEKIGSSGRIIGVDYTKEMLDEARKRIRKNGWENITLIQGDAVHVHKLVNTKVDAIISTYVFSIVYDIEKALKNALKLLKPRGKIVVLDAIRVKSSNKLFNMLWQFYRILSGVFNFGSEEDFDEEKASKKLELWEKIVKENLENVRKKEFKFGTFGLFSGEKK